ncbi:hypothetical protein F4821DRAFT_36196 [Hypoxylon rubiginosum]|uniref:Uncharacterized protein n=1 Tax=Hypoxylon rubiginosum TaxID=110542 RepID=A0ACC0DBI2_9PEZI|nr:hypothetical protein F4821DRAFT_36196 [Hypoxylon rubiginosum]
MALGSLVSGRFLLWLRLLVHWYSAGFPLWFRLQGTLVSGFCSLGSALVFWYSLVFFGYHPLFSFPA